MTGLILRGLRRSPGLTATAVLCLAVGIGATTTMAGIVDVLLFRPPAHVRDAAHVAELHFDFVFPGSTRHVPSMIGQGLVYSHFLRLHGDLHSLDRVAGFHKAELSLGRGEAARPVQAGFVTGGFFPLLGVRPGLGRLIASDGTDAAEAGAAPVVLSDDLWRTRFGRDPSILGRRIRVGRGSYTVVGITPAGFRGPEPLHPTELWLPMGAAERELYDGDREAFTEQSEGLVRVLGRLRPGVPERRVAAEAAGIVRGAYVAYFGERFGDTRVVAALAPIIPGLAGARGGDAAVALWLAAVAAVVLLIACANVAGLLLVRAAERRREAAIRLALGATPWRLARLFLAEALVLAAAGGVLGLLLRQWGGSAVRAFLLPQLDAAPGPLDPRVLGVATLVTLATGILCGAAPGAHAWRRDLAGAVAGARGRGGPARQRAQRALLVGQVALAVALVSGAAAFLTSWWHVRRLPLGFAPARVLVGRMPLDALGYDTPEETAAYERMLARVRALPRVREASLAVAPPFVARRYAAVEIPGVDRDAVRQASRVALGPELHAVGPGFFRATGTRILRGRAFEAGDRAGARDVAIVNERIARTFWPAGDALGRCIRVHRPGPPGAGPPCSRIVGIAADTRSVGLREAPDLQVYQPLAQRPDLAPTVLLVRTVGDPAALAAAARRAMQGAGPALPFADVRPWSTYLDPETRPWRLGASMFTLFGAMALALAALGLYAVFSYAVSRRAPELGIRAALGARAADLLGLVVLDGLRLAAAGVVIGVALALALGRLLAGLLLDVHAASPALLGAAAALVLAITALAVAVPGRGAARADPAQVMREE